MMYKYFNIEPNEERINDCVIRAISLALALPYDEVVKMLYENGLCNSCDSINFECYSKMLDKLGYKQIMCEGLKVEDIAKLGDVMLIRIDGHLTCSIDGCIYDIWDCRNKPVYCYWIIE